MVIKFASWHEIASSLSQIKKNLEKGESIFETLRYTEMEEPAFPWKNLRVFVFK